MLEVTFCWDLTDTWWKPVKKWHLGWEAESCALRGPAPRGLRWHWVQRARGPGEALQREELEEASGSRRRIARRQGNRVSCKQPAKQVDVRLERTPGAVRAKDSDCAGQAPAGRHLLHVPAEHRSAAPWTSRYWARLVPVAPTPRLLLQRMRGRGAAEGWGSRLGRVHALVEKRWTSGLGFNFGAWGLKALSRACRARVAGFWVLQVFLRGWWSVMSQGTHNIKSERIRDHLFPSSSTRFSLFLWLRKGLGWSVTWTQATHCLMASIGDI